MNTELFDYILFVMLLLLPGFVTQRVLSHDYPQFEQNNGNKSYVLWSVVDIILLSPAYIWTTAVVEPNNMLYWVAFLSISFFGGLIIGVIVSIAKRNNWFDLLNRIECRPTAWDKTFVSLKKNTRIVLKLIDGRIIGSVWDDNSFASYGGKDVFISNYYIIEQDGEMQRKGIPCHIINKGMWINCMNLVYLEVE